jgi:hypothetical protein
MKDETIDVKACLLEKEDKISERLNELRGEIDKKAAKRAVMTAVEVLEGLTEIAKNGSENGKLRAMELLGKNQRLFADRLETDNKVEVTMGSDLDDLAG